VSLAMWRTGRGNREKENAREKKSAGREVRARIKKGNDCGRRFLRLCY